MESHIVFDGLQEKDFHAGFEVWKIAGIAMYIPSGTILKGVADRFK